MVKMFVNDDDPMAHTRKRYGCKPRVIRDMEQRKVSASELSYRLGEVTSQYDRHFHRLERKIRKLELEVKRLKEELEY